MHLIKKKLKEDLTVEYGSGHIEHHKKGEELDILEEATTSLHYYVVFDVGIGEYIDKSYFEDDEFNYSDPIQWPESGNLSDMAHDYVKEMEEVYHGKIAQGLFSCVYNAWLDGFMKGISFKEENEKKKNNK